MRLSIDFAPTRPGLSSWLPFVLALVLLSTLIAETLRLRSEASRIATARATLLTAAEARQAGGGTGANDRPAGAASGPSSARRAALAAARRSTGDGGARWKHLFDAVESAMDSDVALLELDADAEQRTLRLVAEARRSEAMLAFQRRLGEGGALHAVTLTGHQLASPYGPVYGQLSVRFTLAGQWNAPDANR
jgi:hypothetical protein